MTEWLYKATPKRVSFEQTRDLAVQDGFLCRSAYTRALARVPKTTAVRLGHLIHVYFRDAEGGRAIGTFEIVPPSEHPLGRHFKALVPGTALAEADDDFGARLGAMRGGPRAEPYRPDPRLKRFTGWLLRLRPDAATPAFDPSWFPPKNTLVPRKH